MLTTGAIMETVTKIGTAWLKLTAIDSSEWLVMTFVMTPLQISLRQNVR
jgi:hypothetical protein